MAQNELKKILILKEIPPKVTYNLSTDELFRVVGHNTGNLVYIYAIIDQVGNPKKVMSWKSAMLNDATQADLVIIPCANQLRNNFNPGSFGKDLLRMNIPTVAVGLGAQAEHALDPVVVSNETIEWVKAIAKLSPNKNPNISLRGEFTMEFIKSIGLDNSCIVGGCPSNFISPDKNLGKKIYSRIKIRPDRVAGMLGNIYWPKLKEIDRQLFDWVKITDGVFIAQDPLDFLYLARGEFDKISPEIMEGTRDHFAPNLTMSNFKDWCRAHVVAFYDVDYWMESLKKFDLVVGPRIHGVQLALQSGIPAVCIALDTRTLELCQIMGVPHIWHENIKDLPADVSRAILQFDPDDYDKKRLALAKEYSDFLTQNGIMVGGGLKKIIE